MAWCHKEFGCREKCQSHFVANDLFLDTILPRHLTLRQRYNLRYEIDPISLNDIDESNECLVGEVDGGDNDAGDELVFKG